MQLHRNTARLRKICLAWGLFGALVWLAARWAGANPDHFHYSKAPFYEVVSLVVVAVSLLAWLMLLWPFLIKVDLNGLTLWLRGITTRLPWESVGVADRNEGGGVVGCDGHQDLPGSGRRSGSLRDTCAAMKSEPTRIWPNTWQYSGAPMRRSARSCHRVTTKSRTRLLLAEPVLRFVERLSAWGPGGDHTACAMVRGTTSTARPDLGDSVCDVRERLPNRPGGQGVVGSNPAVPTG